MIIAIISPIRFKKEMMDKYVELSLQGHTVLLPVDEKDSFTPVFIDENVTNDLMTLHKKKISMADKVLVLNVGGYMGRGTYEEIGFATVIGKDIEYLVPIKEQQVPNLMLENKYRCDPEKNTTCKKTECYIHGGACETTTDMKFKLDERIKCTAILCVYNKDKRCIKDQIVLKNIEYRTESMPKGLDENDKDDQRCISFERKKD